MRLSGPQPCGLEQLMATLQVAPLVTGMGQAMMGGLERASAAAQRRRLQ